MLAWWRRNTFKTNCKQICLFLMRPSVGLCWIHFSADSGEHSLIFFHIYFTFGCRDFFFCWRQLLGPHHAERPNMAVSENRSPGASQNKTGAGVGRAAQQNLADDGSQRASFGERRECFSSSFALFFPAWWAGWTAQPGRCCWHKHSGRALTALLTWHLLLSHQAKGKGEAREQGTFGWMTETQL